MSSNDMSGDNVYWNMETASAVQTGLTTIFQYGGPGPADDVTLSDYGSLTMLNGCYLRKSGALTVKNTSTGNIAEFKTGPDPLLDVGYDSGANYFFLATESSCHFVVESGRAIEFLLDYDNDTASCHFQISDNSHNPFFRIHEDAKTEFYTTGSAVHADLDPDVSGDSVLRLGLTTGLRGAVILRTDRIRPAVLRFSRESETGSGYFVWVDSLGMVRIADADPDVNEYAGVQVSTQG